MVPGWQHYREQLNRVDTKIREWTSQGAAAIEKSSNHLLSSGGKRLRPLLVILSAENFTCDGEEIISLAAAVELLHMATLTHDDIVDRDSMRRGRDSIKEMWGEDAAVLIGDYMFVRAFRKIVELGDKALIASATEMTGDLCDGEIEQLFSEYETNMSEERYYRMIEKKTAHFFRFCCRAGAIQGGSDPEEEDLLADYGYNLGMTFQIVDDVLDVISNDEKLGKPVCSDLRSGSITLPLLKGVQDKSRGEEIKNLVLKGKNEELSDEELFRLKELIIESGAVDYAREKAGHYAEAARKALARPEGKKFENRHHLQEIIEFVMEREN